MSQTNSPGHEVDHEVSRRTTAIGYARGSYSSASAGPAAARVALVAPRRRDIGSPTPVVVKRDRYVCYGQGSRTQAG